MYIDRRAVIGVLGVLVLWSVIQNVLQPGGFTSLLLSLPGVIIAITFHEYAHAFAADKLGDDTPRDQGRLTLNPLKHLDPIGFVLLIFAGFGFGKPVQINPRNFNRKVSMSAGEAIVSLAGPLINIILAFVFMIIGYAIVVFAPSFVGTQFGFYILMMIQMICAMNIGLGIFNLIPLPPLDGSKILKHFLPYKAKIWFEDHVNIFYFIFMFIWITGISAYIISPVIQGVYSIINVVVASIFKIFI